MKLEVLQVTWKFIRRAGYGRTPATYCSYIAENENHKHRLKTVEGTKLFEILETTRLKRTLSNKNEENTVLLDGIYNNDKLIYIKNPRVL